MSLLAPACPCPACARPNRATRAFCGGCGAPLRPSCRGCRFLNDPEDRYCGGCGNLLVADGRGPGAPADPPATAGSTPPAPRARRDELADLFAPVVEEAPPEELPSHGITQANLDQYFGSPR